MNTASRGGAYPWIVVTILMLAHVLSFADRQILNLLVGPIRADLGISDTEMSLLMGFSFAIFYTLCGLPLAWLADRGSRRNLIAAGVLAWSAATAACGLAQHYAQLLAARIGVAIGEATLSPSAFSLITDYFRRERRATAVSIFGTGTYIGGGLAFLIGGLVIKFANQRGPVDLPLFGEIRPWQLVFLILGALGLLFTLLMLLIREPARSVGAAQAMSLSAMARELRGSARALACHHFGFALIALAGYGSSAWIPTYLIRVHGWTAPEVGLTYGSVIAVFGTFGILCGGRLVDVFVARGRTDAPLRAGIFAALGAIPCGLVFYLARDPALQIAMLAIATFILSMPFGAAPAGLQEIVPPAVRARASAVYLLVLNLVGLGFGPTAVALVTDYVFRDDMAVGWSLLWVCGVAELLGALALWSGLAAYRDSYARRRAAEGDPVSVPAVAAHGSRPIAA